MLPILIVGAGPSGSILALVLLHHGIPVRIIETSDTHPIGQWHSSSLMPRSLELFMMLGLLEDILEHAIYVPTLLHYKSSVEVGAEVEMAPYTNPTPASPFLSSVLLSQPRLRNIIHAALAREGCAVETNVELLSVEQFPDHVNVKLARRDGEEILDEEQSYEWLVGADGAAATVCRYLELEFFGDATKEVQQLAGDISVKGLPPLSWHMWGNPPSNHLSLRATEDSSVFTFNITGQNINLAHLAENGDLLRQLLHERLGERPDLEFGDILWSTVYKSQPTTIDKFVTGRVVVTGVASSVICSQALASALQDANNVAWKLALVYKRLAPYSLLNSYTEERLPVIAEMLEKTFENYKAAFPQKEARDDIRKRGYHQLGINYRWSSIVFDERKKDIRERAEEDAEYFHDYNFDGNDNEEEEVLDAYGLELDGTLTAGDRASDALGLINLRDTRRTIPTTWRLFHIFGPSYHTVLVFAEATRRWEAVLKTLSMYPKGMICSALIVRPGNLVPADADFVFEDRIGHAHDAYVLDGQYGIVVIRPDGAVGAISKGKEGVEWYFQGIFARRRL